MNIFGKIRVIDAFKNRREPESVHALADAYWHTLVVLCILGTITIVAFNLWEFSDVDRVLSAQSTSVKATQEKLPFEKKDLETVVDGFAKRKAKYELYSAQAPVVVDPFQITKAKSAR